MEKDFGDTTPVVAVPERTVLVVELVGRSQPIRTSWACRMGIPDKRIVPTPAKKALIANKLAQTPKIGRDRYPYQSMWIIDRGSLNQPHGRVRVAPPRTSPAHPYHRVPRG